MATIHLHQAISLTPRQYIAGLTDFGLGRSMLFGNSSDDYLKVHQLGESQADVTEGSGASGNTSTMTGPIPTTSFSQPSTPTYGEARPATPIPLPLGPTAQLTST